MRALTVLLTAGMLTLPGLATAQNNADSTERGLHLTVFRSPATGLEWRGAHVGVYAGFYPTIIARDGERENVNFIRIGATYYVRDRGLTPYVSPSLVASLDRNWSHGALTEVGMRGKLYRRLHGRLGAAVLTTTAGDVRVNPTIGMDVRLGGSR
jgi:hypothetical protein